MNNKSTVALLLHGLYSTPSELLTLNNALLRAKIATQHCVIPGYSFDTDATLQRVPPKLEQWLDFIQAEIIALRQRYTHVVLIGISAGANLALGVALAAPESVDGVVLLSTPLFYDGWNIPFYRFLLPLALYTPLHHIWQYKESSPYGVKNERMRQWIENELKTRRVSSAGAAVIETPYIHEHYKLQRRILKNLRHTSMPWGLAIHAREDEMVSLKNLRFLQTNWMGKSLESKILDNSYHMITLDNDRHLMSAHVIHFIKQHFDDTNNDLKG